MDTSVTQRRRSKGAKARRRFSGGAIRTLAVPLLLGERGPGPIHYAEWAALLRAEGYGVAGKRPDAVFLNQVTRSPLVRATTKAGYYEIDLDAPQHLEGRLRQQKTKLATLMIENPKKHRRVRALPAGATGAADGHSPNRARTDRGSRRSRKF